MALRFSWDPRKAAVNVRKHEVSFDEAATAFADAHSITIPDPGHSDGESRFILVGMSDAGRLLVVAHAERRDLICLISARPSTRRERHSYEEN